VETEPSSPETLKLPEDRKRHREDVRISLGMKHLKADPWRDVAERYQEGAVVKGRVARVFDFGAFIELEEGIDAFSRREDISWSKNLVNPRKILKAGDTVEAKIISVNAAEKKIQVSLKELLPDPWIGVARKYRPGQRIQGKVVKVIERGAFVQLDETVDGFVSIDDISWSRSYRAGGQYFRTGQDVEAVVLKVDPAERKIDLGIRQMEANPWEVFKKQRAGNNIVKGKIRRVTSAGLVVEIEGSELEGFVHARDIQKEKAERLDQHFKAGDPIEAALVEVQVDRQRIKLSLRKYESVLEAREMDKFIAADTVATEKLGSFFNLKPVKKQEKETR
jgi:small subunit ribosomal protein S1